MITTWRARVKHFVFKNKPKVTKTSYYLVNVEVGNVEMHDALLDDVKTAQRLVVLHEILHGDRAQ
jgi:hypothetical protein